MLSDKGSNELIVMETVSTISINKNQDEKVESVREQQSQDENDSKWQRLRSSFFSPWYKDISVEPTMFLYMFAFNMTSVVEQDFFLQKACRVNMNYSAEICQNIQMVDNKQYKEQVQKAMTQFLQWEGICGHAFPILLALFLGSFSDRRGRKLPLLIGLFGKLYYSSMIIVNAQMTWWPLEYVLYTATLPCALTGSDLAIFASCFAYLADTSTLRNRTLRMTILDVVYLGAMPSGVALGSYLFSGPFKGSYSLLFAVNVGLLVLSIIYSFSLKWQTTLKQKPLSEVGCCGIVGDFFDRQHVKDTYRVLVKPRPGHRRLFLIILLVAMALYTFQRDESRYMYLYTAFAFKWNTVTFSNFKTFKSTAYVIGVLLAVPIMNKGFNWRDTTIILVGTTAHATARLFYYFASVGQVFYVGALIMCVGPVVAPMLRAITSKIVPIVERGKVFALLAVCDNAISFISGVCYTQVYQATLNSKGEGGGGIYLLTIATQMTVFLLALCMHLVLGKGSFALPEDIEKDIGVIMDKEELDSNLSVNTNTQNTQ